MTKMEGIKILNDGNPIELGHAEGFLFTVSPSTAKKGRGYYTDKLVPMTKWELEMPGVVIGQDRGMLFSGKYDVNGDYVIPLLKDINLIIVDEVSRKLTPINDNENIIAWKGDGERTIKDVIADGQGQHWLCHADGRLADDLWLKLAAFLYGGKGMLQPGLATDIGCKVKDHWGVERTITKGNTILLNSSLVKGLGVYNSLEELIEHSEEWGLVKLMKQWQSGDHEPEKRRILGTQPNSTNLTQTKEEITELLKREARMIWSMQFPKIAWMKQANINTSRGRAIAARPSLIRKNLIMNQINSQAGNTFLRLAKGQFKAEGEYLKMFEDKLAFSYVYVHGMDPNEAAKKAAETGLHGEIRVNPSFAGYRVKKDENGNRIVEYKKETALDAKGRYIETALVRYPHGAPSETIIVKAYLDMTIPKDVIVFPAPVANDKGEVPVRELYAFRLQGADFDGDAVTAFTEKIWLNAQKRNAGKSYMIIPVNTVSTEKDKEKVTDETWAAFCQQKVDSLSNRVGLIATSLKYFMSQCAWSLLEGKNVKKYQKLIVDHACAMGDDIDEFKHGKAENDLVPFIIPNDDEEKDEVLYGPYFNRYACKYKDEKEFENTIFTKNGKEKKPGKGILDTYAVCAEELMNKAGMQVVRTCTKATDGKNRYYFTVNPVKWAAEDVDLFAADHGEAPKAVSLPKDLETVYGVEPGTTFNAKELFQMLYRNHSATCKMLLNGIDREDDCDKAIEVISKINEKYALAKVTVIAWTKAMQLAKDGKEISSKEALEIFTTLMTMHTKKSRSIIDVLCETGTFTRQDGSSYEKTEFAAQRMFNYFLDVCGDGLLFQKEEEVNLPEVSEAVIKASEVSMPDMEKARKNAITAIGFIDKLVNLLPNGIKAVCEEIEKKDTYTNDDDYWFTNEEEVPDYDFEVVNPF